MLQERIGFHSDVEDLHLEVEVHHDGWNYRIVTSSGRAVLRDWTLPPYATTGDYSEPGNTKFHAVSEALLCLGKTQDDTHVVFRRTVWYSYASRSPSLAQKNNEE